MALGPAHLSAHGVEARSKMGIFRRDRPYGVALLRLWETSLSLSNRYPDSGYVGMKPEKKPSGTLVLIVWFLIFMGAAFLVWGIVGLLVLIYAPFSA